MSGVKIVRTVDDTIVNDIVSISLDSYPPGWSCGNSEELYHRVLRGDDTILVMMQDGARNVGFLFAVPHDDAVKELKNDDPLMTENPGTYYVQNTAILPAYRGKTGLGRMLAVLREELRKRGIFTLSMHARVSNGLSRTIRDHMKIVEIRRVDNWKYYGHEEPTDFIRAEWH